MMNHLHPRRGAWNNDMDWRSLFTTCCAVVLLLSASSVAALTGKPMRFERISMSDGLSQSTLNVVKQDQTGFLWLGTENGLNRYDGYRFHHYKAKAGDPNTLAADFIWDIAEDASGDLWLATKGGGLARWDAQTDTFEVLRHNPEDANSLSSDLVRAVLSTSDGWIWAGTREHGLERIDPESLDITHYRHDPNDARSLGGNAISALLRDARGTVWVGTDNGLSRFDPITGAFLTYRVEAGNEQSLSDNEISALYEDRQGTLWVGTRGGGLNVYDRSTDTFRRYMHNPKEPGSLSNNWVRAILQDDSGRIWIGTPRGLNLFDVMQQQFVHYVHERSDPGSLSDSFVTSLFQDKSGVLWVGTRSSGLNKWNPRSWGFGHHAAGQLSYGNVTSFAEDRRKNLWVGTFGGGVNRITRGSTVVKHIRHDAADPESLSDDRIMSLLLDSRNKLWLGTMEGGLNRLDPETEIMERFDHAENDPTTVSATGIMSLYEDRGGNVWVGTFGGGVNRINGLNDEVTRYPHTTGNDTGLASSRATAFAQDARGRIWIGTDGGGLNVLQPDSGKFYHFRNDLEDPQSLSADSIYALHVDIKGRIWVGTQGGGLNQVIGSDGPLEAVRFRNLNQVENPVTNDVIYGIESDTQGHLWLSTNYGLTQYIPNRGVVRTFHRSHGLQDEEFNFGAHYRNSSGELFFGGANGFNAFYPSDLKINELPPEVIITQVSLLNQPININAPHWRADNLNLNFRDDVISFEFSALDYTAPTENRYAYMLEGFDPGWIEADSLHHVTYTNLDGGDYTFRVRAANSDGVWQEEGAAVQFHAAPPPWKTWWAYTGYAAFALLVLSVFWRSQQKRLQRESEYRRRLEQNVQLRTRELALRNEELKNLNQRFLTASLTDPLTGLRNRRYVFQEVAKDIDIVRRRYRDTGEASDHPAQADMVFMMIDMDNFKPVNDTCGHAAGDKLLLEVRDVLLAACRQSDTVIRWGGDEFLVIGRYSDSDQAEALAERIRASMAEKVFSIGSGQVARTTCSIGMASYPFVRTKPDMLEWEQVLSLADAAMYRAKSNRNAWVSFVATADSGAVANPFYSFRDHADQMVDQGMLAINDSGNGQSEEACA
ncbi:MAG: two-component regulator propeller domain-containing protein [Gammaproteobacteria bacterium]